MAEPRNDESPEGTRDLGRVDEYMESW